MKIQHLFFLGLCIIFLAACNAVKLPKGTNAPLSHNAWTALLQKHVDANGDVDYKGFIQDSNELNQYSALLSKSPPDPKTWTNDEQMAYWINSYNVHTVQLIMRHYPLNSIKDIKGGIVFVNTIWDVKFIDILGKKYDLNQIEHGILRKEFNEPRIHFAVNCASISCPKLRNEAYTGAKLQDQLQDQANIFFADESKNNPGDNPPKLSPLLNWFKKDFTKNGPLISYVNQFLDSKINDNAEVEWMGYDWGLNESK